MSKEYPCVYHKDGWCYLEPEQPDACVFGPCEDETPSHGDEIRGMNDEELAAFFAKNGGDKVGGTAKFYLEWLRKPAKED